MTTTDPYLWLEEVEGERALAWVREQNERSLAVLESDPRFAAIARRSAGHRQQPRSPAARRQCATAISTISGRTRPTCAASGAARRSPTTRAATRAGKRCSTSMRSRAPRTRTGSIRASTVSKARRAAWSRSPTAAATPRPIANSISRTRSFVEGGFVVPEAKSVHRWLDRDTLLVGTDWGEGTMTESGYPFVLKRWRRGTPLASATEIMRGEATRCGVLAGTLEDVDGRARADRGRSRHVLRDPPTARSTARRRSASTCRAKPTIQASTSGHLIVHARRSLARPAARRAGCAIRWRHRRATRRALTVLFAPSARQSIEGVAITRDAILVAGFENVRGRLLRFALRRRRLERRRRSICRRRARSASPALRRPKRRAFARYEDYLDAGHALRAEDRATRARAVRSLPAQFDASRFVTEQFEATSRDGTRVPVLRGAPRATCSSTARTRRCSTPMAASRCRNRRATAPTSASSGSSAAASMCSPTSAAAASSARPGTKRACARTAKCIYRRLLRGRAAISWRAASPARAAWALWAARTAAC